MAAEGRFRAEAKINNGAYGASRKGLKRLFWEVSLFSGSLGEVDKNAEMTCQKRV
jgi:hypothetical protein